MGACMHVRVCGWCVCACLCVGVCVFVCGCVHVCVGGACVCVSVWVVWVFVWVCECLCGRPVHEVRDSKSEISLHVTFNIRTIIKLNLYSSC